MTDNGTIDDGIWIESTRAKLDAPDRLAEPDVAVPQRHGSDPAMTTVQPAAAGPSDEQIEQAARLLFDKANPDSPEIQVRNRDTWFDETRDYWMRAARELAAVLGTPMSVRCPCGWTAAGPAKETRAAAWSHRCEHTDPFWKGKA